MRLASLLLFIPAFALAQTKQTQDQLLLRNNNTQQASLKSLTVGDPVPNVHFDYLMNYPSSNADLSSFRGKLVILDFFATWCTSCIREVPHLEQLQKQFRDKVQVLMVTSEGEEIIRNAQNRIRKLGASQLPIIYNDSTLRKLFPHSTVPHEVWIDPSGVVAGITDGKDVNSENITAILKGEKPPMALKSDPGRYDPSQPFFVHDKIAEQVKYSSSLTGYIPALRSVIGRRTAGQTVRNYYINQPVLDLYRIATGFPKNRIITENTVRAVSKQQPKFCYEQVCPVEEQTGKIKESMLKDLNSYSGFIARVEKRLLPCWLLTAKRPLPPSIKSISAVGSDPNNDSIWYYNKPVPAILKEMNSNDLPIIVDGTDIHYNIDLVLPGNATQSIEKLKSALSSKGLELRTVERDLEVLVITKAKQ
jgi:thiol-disulfide isomerase/thioredoxin